MQGVRIDGEGELRKVEEVWEELERRGFKKQQKERIWREEVFSFDFTKSSFRGLFQRRSLFLVFENVSAFHSTTSCVKSREKGHTHLGDTRYTRAIRGRSE